MAGALSAAELELELLLAALPLIAAGRRNHCGQRRASSKPAAAAAAIRAGKGRCNTVSPRKARAAITARAGWCRVRRPSRQAACSTTAITAGLSAQNTAASSGS